VAACFATAAAETYPSRPITIVVPYLREDHRTPSLVLGATMDLPYDVLNDFEPVALLADTPICMVARNTLPPKDLTELIAWLKQIQATPPLELSALVERRTLRGPISKM
jgi:tripartite-type tricarboxylate transporter receptor subunit TctC